MPLFSLHTSKPSSSSSSSAVTQPDIYPCVQTPHNTPCPSDAPVDLFCFQNSSCLLHVLPGRRKKNHLLCHRRPLLQLPIQLLRLLNINESPFLTFSACSRTAQPLVTSLSRPQTKPGNACFCQDTGNNVTWLQKKKKKTQQRRQYLAKGFQTPKTLFKHNYNRFI